MRFLRFLLGMLVASLGLVLPTGAHGLSAVTPTEVNLAATAPGQTESSASPSSNASSPGTSTTPGTGNTDTLSNTSGPAGVSVPRLMLQALTTDPATVTAGETFTLTFTLVNTSTRTRVNNIKVTLSQGDGAFLPDAGSSSLYIPTIKAEGTASRDLIFRTLPSLENRPYSMTMQIDYEDTEANAFSTTETISVNIQQPSRADTSSFTVSPEQVTVGTEATINFSLNNMGKTKLFNASIAVAEGQGVEPKTQFIGSVEPGAAANVELALLAIEENTEPITAVISYEDASGNVTTLEKTIELFALPPVDMSEFDPGMLEDPEQKETGFVIEAWMYWAAGGVLLALIALIVILKVLAKKRAAKEQADDIGLLDDDVLAPRA